MRNSEIDYSDFLKNFRNHSDLKEALNYRLDEYNHGMYKGSDEALNHIEDMFDLYYDKRNFEIVDEHWLFRDFPQDRHDDIAAAIEEFAAMNNSKIKDK